MGTNSRHQTQLGGLNCLLSQHGTGRAVPVCMKTRNHREGSRSRKAEAPPPAVSPGDFTRVLRSFDLPNDELVARFKRAAPMLAWGGFDLVAQVS